MRAGLAPDEEKVGAPPRSGYAGNIIKSSHSRQHMGYAPFRCGLASVLRRNALETRVGSSHLLA